MLLAALIVVVVGGTAVVVRARPGLDGVARVDLSPGPSRLPWSSGAVGEEAGFAAWRRRPLDNTTTWPARSSWAEISRPDLHGAISSKPRDAMLSIGLAMLPEPAAGASFAACATGAYDKYYRAFGKALVRLGRGDSIVRLGWEANASRNPWSIGPDVAGYKACFRRQVAAIRATAPRVRIDWNMNKDTHMPGPVTEAWPGDDVVDIVGVSFYDQWPAYPDQAAWDDDYERTQNGGPRGLGTWLRFAREHGKPLSVPEWGVAPVGRGGGSDNPFYIRAMRDFFAANADDIAYETYFNRRSGFRLWPSTIRPRSAAEYLTSFGRPLEGTVTACGR